MTFGFRSLKALYFVLHNLGIANFHWLGFVYFFIFIPWLNLWIGANWEKFSKSDKNIWNLTQLALKIHDSLCDVFLSLLPDTYLSHRQMKRKRSFEVMSQWPEAFLTRTQSFFSTFGVFVSYVANQKWCQYNLILTWGGCHHATNCI